MVAPAAPATATYRLWRTDVRVVADSPSIVTALDRLCRQFAHPVQAPHTTFHVARKMDRGLAIRRDGSVVDQVETDLRAVTRLEWQMVSAAVDAERDFVHLHGAALTRRGRTILIPGGSGIGKSTLALALACQGFDLLGDDVVFVDPANGHVHPFQRALHVHEDALPMLADVGFAYDPARHLGPYLETGVLKSWHAHAARPISSVLMVEWDAGGSVETLPLTQAEVAIELGRFSRNLRTWPEQGLPLLQRLLAPTQNLRVLRTQDLAAAVRVIRDFVDASAPAAGAL